MKDLYKVSEISLVYRSKVSAKRRPKVSRSEQAYEIFKRYWDYDRIELIEEFKILLLNRANQAIGIVDISSGGGNGTVVDAKLIFSSAIKANASAIILAHNHPSGNLNPSDNDIKVTNRLTKAAELLEIQVLDHIILTAEGYHSMADHGTVLFNA